ncbi:MAG: ferrochelatase [Candidatus Hydrothermarchaeales archaeon]
MDEDKKGVILLNLGGPDSLDGVRPFLFSLFSDREIIRLGPSFLQKPIAWVIAATRARKTRENYRLIGGGSPILDITKAQARALEERLRERGRELKTYVGMRYWHPSIGEAVERAAHDGIDELIALPLFPHYSRATTGSCFNELKKAIGGYGKNLDVTYVKSWHEHPLYIKALAASIKEGFKGFSSEERNEVQILFSAHALPQKFVDEGDPYVDQVAATINALSSIIDIGSWKLSFQSRSGPVTWIGPETRETIRRLAREGIDKVLLVPISFVSDHMETLYEMDILYKKQAEKLGIAVVRAPSLNTSSKFIEALADIVKVASLEND